MQMEKAVSRRRKAAQFGTVLGLAAAGVLFAATPSWAAADTATVNPGSGPASTAVPVTMSVASSSAAANQFIQGTTYVTFEPAATCPTTQTGSSPSTSAANVTVISGTKLSFNTPATLTISTGNSSGPTWSVCAYNGVGGALQATAPLGYSVGALPTITSWSPKAASTQGGGTIIVNGTNLTGATVTIGGVAVSGFTSTSGTTGSGTIPAHGAGSFPLIVTASGGGTATQAAAFNYANGVTVTPNVASNSKARTDVSVTGTNLSGITFGTTTGATPQDSNGHVYLTKGAYDPTKTTAGTKTNGEVAECLNVLPISNTELVCSMYLSTVSSLNATASRTFNGTVSGTTLTSALGAFTTADIGEALTGPASIGANTYITAVTSPTTATLNKAPSAAISSQTSLTLAPTRTATDVAFNSGATTITSPAGAQFSSADIGRAITGTGLSSQTITAVTSPTTATISAPTTAVASGTYTITATKAAQNPVPVGTYTVTVTNNGTPDAQNNSNYTSSVVSSGSTFTVADF